MRSALVVLLIALGGCPVEEAPTDAGVSDVSRDVTTFDSSVPVPLPDPPALPELTPCPDGWLEVDPGDGTPAHCAPFSAPLASGCGPGQAAFVGEGGCAPVGPPCPADGWPAGLPMDRPIIHVRADATPGGDGTESAPLSSIAEAVAVAPDGAVIAIAPGEYRGSVVVELVDLSLIGACLSAVLEGDAAAPVLTLRRTTSELQNLRLVGDHIALNVFEASADVTSVEISPTPDGVQTTSISVQASSTLTGESLALTGPMNDGLSVSRTSNVDVRRVVIDGAAWAAVRTTNATFRARDLAIRDYGRGGSSALGIYSGGNSEVTLERVAIVGGFGEPLLTADETVVAITNGFIQGPPLAVEAPLSGIGIIGSGSSLTLNRVYVDRLRDDGVVAALDSHLAATDLIVADIIPATGRDFGHGIELAAGSSATLERVYVARATVLGLLVDGAGTVADATDLTIVDMAANRGGAFGRAIQVQRGASLALLRARASDSLEAGVVVSTSGSSLSAEHLEVERTDQRRCAAEGGACQTAGVGLGVYEEATASVERFRIAESYLAGIQLATDGGLDAAGGVVESNPVGANVQVPGYDLSRLTTNVVYRDNGTNLDAADLPVPEPTTSVATP